MSNEVRILKEARDAHTREMLVATIRFALGDDVFEEEFKHLDEDDLIVAAMESECLKSRFNQLWERQNLGQEWRVRLNG